MQSLKEILTVPENIIRLNGVFNYPVRFLSKHIFFSPFFLNFVSVVINVKHLCLRNSKLFCNFDLRFLELIFHENDTERVNKYFYFLRKTLVQSLHTISRLSIGPTTQGGWCPNFLNQLEPCVNHGSVFLSRSVRSASVSSTRYTPEKAFIHGTNQPAAPERTMTDIPPPIILQKPLFVPERLLMGPGPSNCPSRVLNALRRPLLGHLDEDFLQIMEETKLGIKYAFQTVNSMTFAVTGTGHCAMETAICNILEKGDTFLSIIGGTWGERAFDVGSRIGANCYSMKLSLGEVLNLAKLDDMMLKVKPSLLFVCHGESSCGLLQPLEGISDICEKYECLLLVDAVASLGAVPLFMDKYGIDILYSGSQKVLSAPPGLSPISFGVNALKKIKGRKTSVTSFYMDVPLLGNYWNCDENPVRYHHTGSASLVYGLREALAILAQETLETSWFRHKMCAEKLHEGLEKLGLTLLVSNKKHRLPTVTAVKIPDHVNSQNVIQYLRKRFDIDIAGGLGPTKGLVWRLGLMGHNCTEENVNFLLHAIEDALRKEQTRSRL